MIRRVVRHTAQPVSAGNERGRRLRTNGRGACDLSLDECQLHAANAGRLSGTDTPDTDVACRASITTAPRFTAQPAAGQAPYSA